MGIVTRGTSLRAAALALQSPSQDRRSPGHTLAVTSGLLSAYWRARYRAVPFIFRSAQLLRSATVKLLRKGFAATIISRVSLPLESPFAMVVAASALSGTDKTEA